MNKMNKKGFTLIEMLVVIAIIAILVSIVIPVIGDSTEKAREAKDAANIRAAIAEVTATSLTSGEDATEPVTLTQTGDWDFVEDIAGITSLPTGGSCTVKCTYATGEITIE